MGPVAPIQTSAKSGENHIQEIVILEILIGTVEKTDILGSSQMCTLMEHSDGNTDTSPEDPHQTQPVVGDST